MAYKERLDEILARRGFSTNRKIRRFLQRNVVEVNNIRALTGGIKVSLFEDTIKINGKDSNLQPDCFIMMNKKSGYICSNAVDKNLKTEIPLVFDFLPDEIVQNKNLGTLHTIGRLDVDTEGLLVFTTNGDFSHKIALPECHINKTYEIILEKECTLEMQNHYISECEKGISVCEEWNSPAFTCRSATLVFLSPVKCRLTISEGKYHQVKRMIAALGNKVAYLKRISMGSLKLDSTLEPGQWRFLSPDELELFFE